MFCPGLCWEAFERSSQDDHADFGLEHVGTLWVSGCLKNNLSMGTV